MLGTAEWEHRQNNHCRLGTMALNTVKHPELALPCKLPVFSLASALHGGFGTNSISRHQQQRL
jgi:hypothetical protein